MAFAGQNYLTSVYTPAADSPPPPKNMVQLKMPENVFPIHNKLGAEVRSYFNNQMRKKVISAIHLGRFELNEVGLNLELDTDGTPKLIPPSFSYRITIEEASQLHLRLGFLLEAIKTGSEQNWAEDRVVKYAEHNYQNYCDPFKSVSMDTTGEVDIKPPVIDMQ